MAETMAEKAKKQRASKATGLYKEVGKFKGKKSLNLKGKQLGKKGRAAAKKRTVSISKTEHMKEGPNKGKVVGPKGKPLTGKVDMGGGNMAVYRNGKRVTAKPATKKNDKGGSGGGNGSNKITPVDSSLTEAQKRAKRLAAAKVAARKADAARSKTDTATTVTKKAGSGSSAGAKKPVATKKSPGSGSSAVQRVNGPKKPTAAKSTKTTSRGNGKKWYEQGGGGLTGSNSPIKGGRSKLKEGSTRMMVEGAAMNTKRVKYVVRGGKWVRA